MKPTRPAVAEINLQAILENYQEIKHFVGKNVKVMAVVKANAYGHGDLEVSRALAKNKVDYFGVAFPEEGARLRQGGVKGRIHVLTLPVKSQARLFVDYSLEATVCSLNDVKVLASVAGRNKKPIKVHVKVETGMNRIGVRVQDLDGVIKAVGRERRLEIKGVFTHFATSEEPDSPFARRQLSEFERAMGVFQRQGVDPELVHCANSGAILQIPESYFSMVRPGILLYGYYPSRAISHKVQVRPAMTVKTSVALVKEIHAGDSVSYARRFVAQRRTRIATLPIGYADGFPRTLTSKSHALIGGGKHPIVGTICMDQLMVDVGNSQIDVGDEAVLMGEQAGQRISAWDLADRIGTVPYEILCGISSRVPRTFVYS